MWLMLRTKSAQPKRRVFIRFAEEFPGIANLSIEIIKISIWAL